MARLLPLFVVELLDLGDRYELEQAQEHQEQEQEEADRAAQRELQTTPDLASLLVLQRELIELKSDALARFSAGDLGRTSALSELLPPIHGAERHIANLLLNFRSNG